MYIPRLLETDVIDSLENNPVTAVLGPRQCGKSTMVKNLLEKRQDSLYLDLERPSDLRKLDDAEWFLGNQLDKLVCLDEIQRKPEIFPLLRSLIDQDRKCGMYVILGSASAELLRQSSESLAGRISFKHLTPFLFNEIKEKYSLEIYMTRGGFPPGLLAKNNSQSLEWRQDFIRTFLERDLMQFSGFSPVTMRRLWQMLAHYNGQLINYSALGSSLGVSHTTIRNYIDLLEGTFMLFQLRPWIGNTKKRLVKSPRIYISDPGITAALLNLGDFNQLAGHPVFGSLWETIVLANLKGHFPDLEYSFYRTSHGAEIDFVISNGSASIAIESKATLSPDLSKGNYNALEELKPKETFIVAPTEEGYPFKKNIRVVSLYELIDRVGEIINSK